MPNWCENELRVSGKSSDIEDFMLLVKSGRESESDFDFEKIIPYPDEYAAADQAQRDWDDKHKDVPWSERPHTERPKDGYNSGGYEWCIKNWGTKWNACETGSVRTARGCYFTFNTAWGPPRPVIERAAELFPSLTFHLKYWEGGAGFKGALKVKGDTFIEDWEDGYRGNRGG